MAYYVYLDSKFIANSETEYRAHKWPDARWYIALESEEDSLKYQKNERKSKAFAALHSLEMTDEMKKRFVIVLDQASSRTNLTKEQIHNILFSFIDKTTFNQGSNLDKFEELYVLMQTATGRDEIEARYLLKRAVDCRIIYEKQGSYTYNKATGPIVVGETYAEAINFILNPKKATIIEDLVKEINSKIIE